MQPGSNLTVMDVLGALAFAVMACGDGGDPDLVDRFVTADEHAFAAACECGGPDAHCEVELIDECERTILRRNLDAIGGWLECRASSLEAQTSCVLEAGCTEAMQMCAQPSLESRCEEQRTPQLDDTSDEILRTCLKDIRCDDRTTTRGRYCNSEAECADGSDEKACGGQPGVFGCANGVWLAQRFVCDGVDDCGDSGDEFCGGVILRGPEDAGSDSDPTGIEACTQTVSSAMGDASSDECASCLCGYDLLSAEYCDADCWELVRCVAENCGADAQDLECVMDQCLDYLVTSAVTASPIVRPEVRDACGEVCPLLVPE
jgi:hypothetical protein